MEEKIYTISEVGKMFNLPASTLRYYEELGLLPDVRRNGKKRIYTECHIARLQAIECFKQANLPLGKMMDFFTYEKDLKNHIDDIIEIVEGHEIEVKKQMEELEKGLSHIQKKVRYYRAIKDSYEQGTSFPCYDSI